MATVLVSLLAAAIALLGACIAWGQWYTARQKLVLDLFEKRLEVFVSIHSAIKRASSTKATVEEWENTMSFERGRIRFLFGTEIEDWARELQDRISKRMDAMEYRRDPQLPASEVANLEKTIQDGRTRLLKAEREWVGICNPYLRMDQKLPRPPYEWPGLFVEWLRHRYADRSDGTG